MLCNWFVCRGHGESLYSKRVPTGKRLHLLYMIRHEVLIKFKRQAGPDEIAAAVQKLRGLAFEIPAVDGLQIGRSPYDPKGPSPHCLIVFEVADETALQHYNNHPTRAKIAQLVSTIADNVAVADLPG